MPILLIKVQVIIKNDYRANNSELVRCSKTYISLQKLKEAFEKFIWYYNHILSWFSTIVGESKYRGLGQKLNFDLVSLFVMNKCVS